jgi:tetratricopeptide (TPR) repeat protein
MGEGEFALVRQQLDQATGASIAYFGEHDVYATMADVAALERDEAAILAYAPKAEELAARYDHKLYRAIANRAWGVAHRLRGEQAEAAKRLKHGLTLFQEVGARWQAGRTLFELGELAVAQHESDQARDYFQRALGLFEAMRAAPDAARVKAALLSLER